MLPLVLRLDAGPTCTHTHARTQSTHTRAHHTHSTHTLLFIYLFIYLCFTAQVLKVCTTPGTTACLKMLSKVCLKSWRRRKNSMTTPGQPSTCSHPIYARTFTDVYQAVRYFSPCYFHVYTRTHPHT